MREHRAENVIGRGGFKRERERVQGKSLRGRREVAKESREDSV